MKKNTFSNSSAIITDNDGNVYHTITIGTQVWLVENLKTTKYNDGTVIPLVTDNKIWFNLKNPGCCWYNNDASSNKQVYGALYNWYAVNTGKLCPAGWHVPSDAEWTILTTYLGGDDVAGGKMKETGATHWLRPNTGAANSSGFTGLPAGYRGESGFIVGGNTLFWSSTEFNADNAWIRYLLFDSAVAGRNNGGKYPGCSVRCLKDLV
jgi:uncharacterized protein (TIGR02145 family)